MLLRMRAVTAISGASHVLFRTIILRMRIVCSMACCGTAGLLLVLALLLIVVYVLHSLVRRRRRFHLGTMLKFIRHAGCGTSYVASGGRPKQIAT